MHVLRTTNCGSNQNGIKLSSKPFLIKQLCQLPVPDSPVMMGAFIPTTDRSSHDDIPYDNRASTPQD